MIYVRSQAAGVRCASCTGEANRMWSAVCSLTSTADRLPGEKMMPGGGVARSKARIMGQSASGQRDRNLRSTPGILRTEGASTYPGSLNRTC
jgi:hypothetical protein